MASWAITDYDSTYIQVVIDGTITRLVKKTYIQMEVSGDILIMYRHDKERRNRKYIWNINWNDVTAPTVSSATDLMNQIKGWINTAGGVQSVTALSNIPVKVDNTDPLNPVLDFEWATSTETADFTLNLTQAWSILVCDTAAAIEITIPANASVAFPIGTQLLLTDVGVGSTAFVADVGVTVNSRNGWTAIDGPFGVVRLTKIATNEWAADGDLKESINANAQAYIDAVVANGGTLSAGDIDEINTFVLVVESIGWSKFNLIYLFMGGVAGSNKLNLISPLDTDAAHRLLFYGSPTHNSNGVTFNGTTQYADTKFSPSTHLAQNSKHYSCYLRTNGTGFVFGSQNSSAPYQADRLTGNFASGGLVLWGTSGIGDSVTNPSPNTGFYLINRSSSTLEELRRNNVLIDSFATTSTYNPAFDIYLAARNWGNSGTSYQNNACNFAFFSAGSSLTSGEQTTLYNAVVALQTALGRNV